MSGRYLLRAFLALCAAMALVVLPGSQVAHAHPVSEGRAPSTRASAGGGPAELRSAFELATLLQLDRRWRLPGKEGAGGAQPRVSAASTDRGRHQSDLGGYRYSAFGKTLPPNAGTPDPYAEGYGLYQPLRWQGRWLDEQTGLYDFRNRVWSPDLGAFLSPDEFRYLSGTGTLWSWPGQNPMRWRDPSGRDPWSGDAIGESWMLERGDLSSEQAQTNAQLGAAGAFTGFLASLGLAAVPALETGVAMGLQRGMMSNQGSLRMLAKVAASAISGARACGDPTGGGGGPTFGGGAPALTPGPGRQMLGQALNMLKGAAPGERAGLARQLLGQIETQATGGAWKATEMAAAGGGRAWVGETHTLVIDASGRVFQGPHVGGAAEFGLVEGQLGVTSWSGLKLLF